MLLALTIAGVAIAGIIIAMVQSYERKCLEAERETRRRFDEEVR